MWDTNNLVSPIENFQSIRKNVIRWAFNLYIIDFEDSKVIYMNIVQEILIFIFRKLKQLEKYT
jgi:predicted Ser/Thr protein kinase